MAIEATDMSEHTSVRVTKETADELYDMKDRGESYEDVIRRLIEGYNEE